MPNKISSMVLLYLLSFCRYTRLPNKKHKKHRKKNKNRKNKTSRTEADTITFVDKSELITLEKLNEGYIYLH